MEKSYVLDCVMGFITGDCFGAQLDGVDVRKTGTGPIYKPQEKNVYGFPFGTFTSVSSLMLCCAKSLANGVDCDDIMENFSKWYTFGYMSPAKRAFAVDNVILRSIINYKKGIRPAVECGKTNDYDSINSVLNYILPLAFVVKDLSQKDKFDTIKEVCKLTNSRKDSHIAASLFVLFIINLFENRDKDKVKIFNDTLKEIYMYFLKDEEYKYSLSKCARIFYAAVENKNKDILYELDTLRDALEVALKSFFDCNGAFVAMVDCSGYGGDSALATALVGAMCAAYNDEDMDMIIDWQEYINKIPEIDEICNTIYSKYIDKNDKQNKEQEAQI